jgi:DNA-binding response OmpR family regulator
MPARVLVVDDDTDLLKAINIRLRSAGYEVMSAQDGMTATHMAVKMLPDVIILDVGMPGGDGHLVGKRLRANPVTTAIPVIYLTARDSVSDRHKALDLGAQAFLVKPCNPQELLSTVARSVLRPAA